MWRNLAQLNCCLCHLAQEKVGLVTHVQGYPMYFGLRRLVQHANFLSEAQIEVPQAEEGRATRIETAWIGRKALTKSPTGPLH
jgi:hypothetical protein